jgi:hypothetical protein
MGRKKMERDENDVRTVYTFEAGEEEMFYYKGLAQRWRIPLASLIRMALRLSEQGLMQMEKGLYSYGDAVSDFMSKRALESSDLAAKQAFQAEFERIKVKIDKDNANTLAKIQSLADKNTEASEEPKEPKEPKEIQEVTVEVDKPKTEKSAKPVAPVNTDLNIDDILSL